MSSKLFVFIALVATFCATKVFAAKIENGYSIVRTSKEKVINKKYKVKNSKNKVQNKTRVSKKAG